MARQAVLDIIEASLGKYISDLDVEKLNLSLWRGQINLPRSMKLDADAINRDFLYHSSDEASNNTSDQDNRVVEDWAINVNCDRRNCHFTFPSGCSGRNFGCNDDSAATDAGSYILNSLFGNPCDANTKPTSGYTTTTNNMGYSRSFLKNFRVVKGTIHRIQIDIPWSALTSRPIVVSLTGVNIKLVPSNRQKMQESHNAQEMRAQHRDVPTSLSPSPYSFYGSSKKRSPSMNAINFRSFGSNHSIGGTSNMTNGSSRQGGHSSSWSIAGGSRNGSASGSQNPRSKNIRQENLANKFFRSIPLSNHIIMERYKARCQKEGEVIRKKRRNVIQRRDDARKRHAALQSSMVMKENSNINGSESQRRGKEDYQHEEDITLDSTEKSSTPSISCLPHRSLLERLKVRLLENLQLDITNVHLQFSSDDNDSASTVNKSFTESSFHKGNNINEINRSFLFGIVLDALSFDTTDEHGRRTYVDRNPTFTMNRNGSEENFLFKSLRINGFGVYLEDRNETGDGVDDYHIREMGSDIGGSIASQSSHQSSHTGAPSLMRHDFIVHPLSFEAAYRQSDNPHSSSFSEYPKFLLFSQLPHLSIMLSRAQLELAHDIMETLCLERLTLPVFPEYRPSCSITPYTAKMWWQYAYKCVRRILSVNGTVSRRRNCPRHNVGPTQEEESIQQSKQTSFTSMLWLEFVWAANKRKRYLLLYKRFQYHAHFPWLEPLSALEINEMRSIEDDVSISIEGIILWRTIVETDIEKERLENTSQFSSQHKQTRNSGGAFSGLVRMMMPGNVENDDYFSSTGLPSSGRKEYQTFALTTEEIEELEHQLDVISDRYSSLPPGSKLLDIEFSFGSVVVDLVTTRNSQPLAKLRLGTIETLCSTSVKGENLFRVSMLSVQVEDTMTIQPIFPIIFRSVHTKTHVDNEHQNAPSNTSFSYSSQSNGNHSYSNNNKNSIMMDLVESEGSSWPQAFMLTLTSSPEGSGHCNKLDVHLVAFEFVASSPFLEEMIDFFAPVLPCGRMGLTDPLMPSTLEICRMKLFSIFCSSLNDIMFPDDCNYSKHWEINCEVNGPILVLPEFHCDNNSADVLVIDCGNYAFKSNSQPSQKVNRWLDKKKTLEGCSDCGIWENFWTLQISNIRCILGSANVFSFADNDSKEDNCNSSNDEDCLMIPLMDSVSVTVEAGTYAKKGEFFHIFYSSCIPSIEFITSLDTLCKSIRIISSWSSIRKQIFRTWTYNHQQFLPVTMTHDKIHEDSSASTTEILFNNSSQKEDNVFDVTKNRLFGSTEWSFIVHKLVVRMSVENKGFFEANLMSLESSASRDMNKVSACNLNVGWLWLLQKTDINTPPKLLIHSNLPPTVAISSPDLSSLKVINEIEKIDVTGTATNFVNISLSIENFISGTGVNTNAVEKTDSTSLRAGSLDLTLSNLHVNWHPQKNRWIQMIMTHVQEQSIPPLGGYPHERSNCSPILHYDEMSSVYSVSTDNEYVGMTSSFLETLPSYIITHLFHGASSFFAALRLSSPWRKTKVKIQLNMLALAFYSEVDDYKPIFDFAFADVAYELTKQSRSCTEANFKINKFSLDNFAAGHLCPGYEQIIKMCMSVNEKETQPNILKMNYRRELSATLPGNMDRYKTFISTNLSPINVVFSLTQVSAFQQYMKDNFKGLTPRILRLWGTFYHMTESDLKMMRDDLFLEYQSAGIAITVPQSIQSPKFFEFRIKETTVRYNFSSFPGRGGGGGCIKIHGLTLVDGGKMQIISNPLNIDLDASLDISPRSSPENKDDQHWETKINVSVSPMVFLLTRQQYIQILITMAEEEEHVEKILRSNANDKSRVLKYESLKSVEVDFGETILNTEDQSFVNKIRCIINGVKVSLKVNFVLISLHLSSTVGDAEISFLKFAVENSDIAYGSDHIYQEKNFDLSVENFFIENTQINATPNRVRYLLHKIDSDEEHAGDDALLFTFKQSKDGDCTASFLFSAIECMVYPDAVAKFIDFFEDPTIESRENYNDLLKNKISSYFQHENNSEIDEVAAIISGSVDKTTSVNVAFKTPLLRVILLDNIDSTYSDGQVLAHGHVLVCQGKGDVQSNISWASDGSIKSLSFYLNGEQVEVHAPLHYGSEQSSQILDPADLSLVVYCSNSQQGVEVDMKFVSLSDFTVSLSTHKALLVSCMIDNMNKKILAHNPNLQQKTPEEDPDNDDYAPGNVKALLDLVETKGSVTIPQLSLLIVDDDAHSSSRALWKVATENFILGGQGSMEVYDMHVYASTQIEYFNSCINCWEPWFLKPYDMSMSCKRRTNDSARREGKYKTSLDFDMSPLNLTLSQAVMGKILCSLDALSRMYGGSEIKKSRSTILDKNIKSEYSNQSFKPFGVMNQTNSKVYIAFAGSRSKLCEPGSTHYLNSSENNKKKYKYITLLIGHDGSSGTGENTIVIEDILKKIHTSAIYDLGNDVVLFTKVEVLEGSVILRLRPQASLVNCTNMNFAAFATMEGKKVNLGILSGIGSCDVTHESIFDFDYACIPNSCLLDLKKENMDASKTELHFYSNKEGDLMDSNIPCVWGCLCIPSWSKLVSIGKSERSCVDISVTGRSISVQTLLKVELVNDHPLLEIYVQPRLILQNRLAISVLVGTHASAFRANDKNGDENRNTEDNQYLHRLDPLESLHILSPGTSVSLSVLFADNPVVGVLENHTMRMSENISIPNDLDMKITEPIKCVVPLNSDLDFNCSMFVHEENIDFAHSNINYFSQDFKGRVMSLKSKICFVDHTCNFLLRPRSSDITNASSTEDMNYYPTFRSNTCFDDSKWQITFFSEPDTEICMVNNEGNDEKKNILPFCINDIITCGGGIESTSLSWDDGSLSGYCAYKSVDFKSSTQSIFIHVVPEFLIINKSGGILKALSSNDEECVFIDPESTVTWTKINGPRPQICLTFEGNGWITDPIHIEKIQTCSISAKSKKRRNHSIGKLTIDVSPGGKNARIIVSVGSPENAGSREFGSKKISWNIAHFWKGDIFRVRIRSKQFHIFFSDSLKQSRPACDVACLSLDGITVDYHKIFLVENKYEAIEENVASVDSWTKSRGRSRLLAKVKQITFEEADQKNSCSFILLPTSSQFNCVEASIYFQEEEEYGRFDIDVVNINLWSKNGVPEKITLNASEAFVNKFVGYVNDMVDFLDESTMKIIFGSTYPSHCCSVIPSPTLARKFKAIRISPFQIEINITGGQERENKNFAEPTCRKASEFLKRNFDSSLPTKIELNFSEFSGHNIQGQFHHVREAIRFVYQSKLNYNLSRLRSARANDEKSNGNNIVARKAVTEQEFILDDLDRFKGHVPGLNDRSAFRRIGPYATAEYRNAFEVVDGNSNHAVIKETGSGTILYSSTSSSEETESPPDRRRVMSKSTSSRLLEYSAAAGNSTRDFFASFRTTT